MKQSKRKSFFGAVNLTASVLAALLLIGLVTGLLTGCPHKPKEEPKAESVITYKVEHWQQNVEDDKYTKVETEEKPGKKDEDTAATAKTYEGFTAKAVTQQKIKADSSTVVKIEYDRNMVTLKLNLNGGTTNPELEDGADGTKILKGKYGAKVKLENLGKPGNVLEKWTPPLPETFPASSPDTTYTASWVDGYIITIKGDKRTDIAENTFIKANLNPIQTWNDIAVQVKAKVSLKSEWQGGDYEVYEWRLGNKTGEKLEDEYPINKHLTVYAVTNYAKFNIIGDKIKLTAEGKGYTGGKPKGRIIIPDGITEIEDLPKVGPEGAFRNCTGITSVQFPQGLTKIGDYSFSRCTGLTSLELSACRSLNQIGDHSFCCCTGLTSLDLPTSLTQIDVFAFAGCTGLTSLTVDSGNTKYKAEHNIVYTKDGKTLLLAAGGLTSVTIPDTVTAIGVGAFIGCMDLERVVFDDTNGWAVYNAELQDNGINWVVDYSTPITTIDSTKLGDAATAAQYLRKETGNGGYSDKYWKKN